MTSMLVVVLALLAPGAAVSSGSPLDGWVNVNGLPTTWRVEGDDLVCTGVPNGMLRTARPYENFVLEFDWKHEKRGGNSGVFVWADPWPARGAPFPRSIEVQVMLTEDVHDEQGRLLYTGQGDIFSIHGAGCTPVRPHPAGWARCLPDGRHTKRAGEWNHYRIEGRGGTITLAVNGHHVSEVRDCEPRRGFLCFEPEGSEIRFRNIKITELPASGLSHRAQESGWRTLFGADLSAWNLEGDAAKHWTVDGTTLRYDGKGTDLWTRESFGDFDLVADWRWTKEHQGRTARPVIQPDGTQALNADGSPKTVEVDERDSGIFLRGSTKAQVNMWMWPIGSGEVYGYRVDPMMPPEVRAACTPKVAADAPPGEWNRFEISLRGDRLIVRLNGALVIDQAQLKDIPARGPIGLQSHGCPVEFTNIYVRTVPDSQTP